MQLAARGARVVVNDLGGPRDGMGDGNREMADAVVAEITDAGGTAIANADSVATSEGADALVAQALDTWGRIDIVVNNAGITGRRQLRRAVVVPTRVRDASHRDGQRAARGMADTSSNATTDGW